MSGWIQATMQQNTIVLFFCTIEFFNPYQIRQKKENELQLTYIRKKAIQKHRTLRIHESI